MPPGASRRAFMRKGPERLGRMGQGAGNLFRIERQEKVLHYINEKQTVKTQELAEVFHTSCDHSQRYQRAGHPGPVIKPMGRRVPPAQPQYRNPSVIHFQRISSSRPSFPLAADMIADGMIMLTRAPPPTIVGRMGQGRYRHYQRFEDRHHLAERGDISLIMTGVLCRPACIPCGHRGYRFHQLHHAVLFRCTPLTSPGASPTVPSRKCM